MAGTLTISTLSDGTNSTSATNPIRGSAKAWVQFASAGTIPSNGSYNVSSVTRNSVGNWTVNFTNPLPNTSYCATYMNANSARYIWFDTFTTSSLNCYCFDTGYADVSLNCVAVFSS